MPSLNTGNAILSNPIKVETTAYNVGIGGAASSSFKLQVTGTTNLTGALTGTTAAFETTTGSRYLQIRDAGTSTPSLRSVNDTIAQLRAIAIEANTISLRTGASSGLTVTEALAISATGAATFSSSVGIGVAPDFPLTVKTDASANSIKIIGRSGGDSLLSFYASNGTTPYLDFSAGATYVNYNAVNSQNYNWYCNSSLKMVLTSGGNVGIGITPYANSISKALDMTGGAGMFGYGDANYLTGNAYFDGGWKAKNAGIGSNVTLGDSIQFLVSNSGSAGGAITMTERMRITSGAVGIGITPSAWYNTDGYAALQVGNASLFGRNATNSELYLSSNAYDNTSGNPTYITDTFATRYVMNTGIHKWLTAPSGTGGGAITFTESMRITSGGFFKASNDGAYISAASPYHELVTNTANNASVIIGNKNASTPYGCYVLFTAASPNDATRWFYNAEDSTATRFTVRSNGGIANYQANDANLSDIRTKKDITPLESYWDKFKAIEIVKFKYKDQTHDDYNIGVIAQQVESVAPEFIDADGFGETPKDGIPLKTVYTADLHHATIKVLQEAMAKIEEQQAQIDELKQIVATK
jgi:hypothetical protein